jgi:hypothetical protein
MYNSIIMCMFDTLKNLLGKHKNIVSMYDVAEEDDCYFLVMEYIEGPTLSEYIQNHGPLSIETNRRSVSSFSLGGMEIALIATLRLRIRSSARYTMLMPPPPSLSMTLSW